MKESEREEPEVIVALLQTKNTRNSAPHITLQASLEQETQEKQA